MCKINICLWTLRFIGLRLSWVLFFFFCCGRGNSYHTENAAHAKYYYFYYYYYRYCYMRNLHAVENEEKQQKLFI